MHFCGGQQGEGKRLVAGPGVYICNDCVEISQEALDEDPVAEAPHKPSEGMRDTVMAPDERETAILAAAPPQALAQLSDPERRILELRYGLSGEQPRSLDEVGAVSELTDEETRRIENQSLAKLQLWPYRRVR